MGSGYERRGKRKMAVFSAKRGERGKFVFLTESRGEKVRFGTGSPRFFPRLRRENLDLEGEPTTQRGERVEGEGGGARLLKTLRLAWHTSSSPLPRRKLHLGVTTAVDGVFAGLVFFARVEKIHLHCCSACSQLMLRVHFSISFPHAFLDLIHQKHGYESLTQNA